MDFVKSKGLRLVDKAGRSVAAPELAGKVVALYFSAHWCPPCRGFTPVLKSFYEQVKKYGGQFEIIFVSSDKTEDEGKAYFNSDHGDWLMLEFAQKGAASASFDIKGIPSLIVIDSSGKPVVLDGRSEVGPAAEKGPVAMAAVMEGWQKLCGDWRETAGETIGGAPAATDKEAMRAARLARLGGGPAPAAAAPASAAPAAAEAPAAAMPVVAAPVAAPSVAPVAARPEAPATTPEVQQLVAMGFTAEQAQQALAAADGNIETAVMMLGGDDGDGAVGAPPGQVHPGAGEVDPAALAQLQSMGFDAEKARQALAAADGNLETATAILLDG